MQAYEILEPLVECTEKVHVSISIPACFNVSLIQRPSVLGLALLTGFLAVMNKGLG